MRTITIESFEGGPALRDIPTPQVGPNEVLVRVSASSVNPLDGGIAAGMLKDMLEHEFPVTLGRDFAGVVEQVGEGVSSVAVGDEVFGEVPGFSPPIRDGAWAELIAASEQTLTKKPDGVDTATAGAAPLAALTALPIVDALELSQGDTVLVVGATGGVGAIVVQLAKAAGARVLASGLPEGSCAAWASTRCSRATATWSPSSASAIQTGWTRWWTRSRRSSPPPTTGSSQTVGASPRRPTPPARVPAARTSPTPPTASCSTASRSTWPMAR